MCSWAARTSDPGAGEGRGQVLGLPGCSECFSLSCEFGSGRATPRRGLAVSGGRSVPDSGVEEPPIRALIQVGLVAVSGSDSAADS